MGAREIHLNDTPLWQVTIYETLPSGTTAAVDISTINTTTGRQFIFTRPGGTASTQTASFLNSGTDGVLIFTSPSGFLDTIGAWKLQARVVLPTGASVTGTFHSDIYSFVVRENL